MKKNVMKISFVTLSENGVFIKNQTEKYYVPAHMRSISDVSGAGDTVIAVATLCLISGASTKQIAEISKGSKLIPTSNSAKIQPSIKFRQKSAQQPKCSKYIQNYPQLR